MLVPMVTPAESVHVIRHLCETGAEAVDHVLDLLEELLARYRRFFKPRARRFDAAGEGGHIDADDASVFNDHAASDHD